MGMAYRGITHCADCGTPLQMGECYMCDSCEAKKQNNEKKKMRKKIKIIELFQEKVNNEELPKKFKYQDYTFVLSGDEYTIDGDRQVSFIEFINHNLSNLDDEIELIEENTIDDIKEIETTNEIGSLKDASDLIHRNEDKINELIRAIKQIDKKLKGEE